MWKWKRIKVQIWIKNDWIKNKKWLIELNESNILDNGIKLSSIMFTKWKNIMNVWKSIRKNR